MIPKKQEINKVSP